MYLLASENKILGNNLPLNTRYLEKPAACWRTIKKEGCVEKNCENVWGDFKCALERWENFESFELWDLQLHVFIVEQPLMCKYQGHFDCPFHDPYPHALQSSLSTGHLWDICSHSYCHTAYRPSMAKEYKSRIKFNATLMNFSQNAEMRLWGKKVESA